MDTNQTHLWNNLMINHQPPPFDHHQSHLQNSTNNFPSFHHSQLDHFPPPSPSFLSNQTDSKQVHYSSAQDYHPKQQEENNHCSQLDPVQLLLRCENQSRKEGKDEEFVEGKDEEEEEDEEEELGGMKEMMYRMAAMQPVEIDPASIRKPRRRNVRISDDPQSVAARHRRERISEKIRILQRLVPGGTKLDTASMLEEAVRYVKFLKRQIRLLQTNNNNSSPTTSSAPSHIITRPTGVVIDNGDLEGFGGFGTGGVHVGGGGGGGDHRLVCFGGDHEVISDR